MTHAVLMGSPTHFSVVGGANPHTRDRWGRRKGVDRELAQRQWAALRARLEGLGLAVIVVPADPEWPGLVYPANAGVRLGDEFILSHLTPTRAGETAHYRRAVEAVGLRCHTLQARFEGEADLFPAGDVWLFTYGEIRKQRFVPRLGIPPWKRVYGFRSSPAALDEIRRIQPLDREILRVRLLDERYYHGDTCLCSFGPKREFLLVYEDVVDPDALRELRRHFGDRMIPLDAADAQLYAANSFGCVHEGRSILVMPDAVSRGLQDRIRSVGVDVITVDVSEFLKKGGGSVKCMIGDLGEISDASAGDEPSL